MPVNLSPPWYIFANQVKYTYGMSPYVQVLDLIKVNNDYQLSIHVSKRPVARALRQVLPLSKDFGGTTVNIIVYDRYGQVVPVENIVYTPETLAQTLCTALHGNSLFLGTVLTQGKVSPIQQNVIGAVVVIIEKYIIQFYSDDISDLCSNYNEVAAKTFAEVTNLNYAPTLNISFSTYDEHCIEYSDLYCKGKPYHNIFKKLLFI